jgi:hypothetical protein
MALVLVVEQLLFICAGPRFHLSACASHLATNYLWLLPDDIWFKAATLALSDRRWR